MSFSVIFFGTPDFSVPTLKMLIDHPSINVKAVVTQPDRPAGRGRRLMPSPVKEVALQSEIPVLQPLKIKKEIDSFLAQAQVLGNFDLGVVVAFGQILPKQVLEFPKKGCVNIHASLLPRWRGAAPIHRAILSGDSKTGVCLMQMDQGLDTGAVYAQAEYSITSNDTFGTMHDVLAQQGADLLSHQIVSIIEGKLSAQPQPEEGITYAEKIETSEGLIDWNKTATEVSRQVRAFSPYPGAWTWLNGKRFKILLAHPKSSITTKGTPGQAMMIEKDRLEIQCGQDILSLSEVQLEGKGKMPIQEFLKGNVVQAGYQFGNKL